MAYQLIEVEPIAGTIGAEISGVDMAAPLGNQLFQEVHDALMAHQVIFFRDQDVTPAQHVAFARHFGSLQVHPFLPRLSEQPEVLILESTAENRSAANIWHSDVSFQAEPALGSLLLAREIPEQGGDTMWSDMYGAYEALSAAMKRYLEGMTAIHATGNAKFENAGANEEGEKSEIRKAAGELKPQEHPIVRTHPVTQRKALYVNGIFTRRIKGVSGKESRAILSFLYEHLATLEFTCRFRWRKNSVAFWDNRCTQHYAIADYAGQHRLMHRVTINGDRPV